MLGATEREVVIANHGAAQWRGDQETAQKISSTPSTQNVNNNANAIAA
jgi:hypothetical protein